MLEYLVVVLLGDVLVGAEDRNAVDIVKGHLYYALIKIDIEPVLVFQNGVDQLADSGAGGNCIHEGGRLQSAAGSGRRFHTAEGMILNHVFSCHRIDDHDVLVVVLDTDIRHDGDETDVVLVQTPFKCLFDEMVEAVILQITDIEEIIVVRVVGEI